MSSFSLPASQWPLKYSCFSPSPNYSISTSIAFPCGNSNSLSYVLCQTLSIKKWTMTSRAPALLHPFTSHYKQCSRNCSELLKIAQFCHGCFSKYLSVAHHKHNSVLEHSAFDSHLTGFWQATSQPLVNSIFFYWSDFGIFLISFHATQGFTFLTGVLLAEKAFFIINVCINVFKRNVSQKRQRMMI